MIASCKQLSCSKSLAGLAIVVAITCGTQLSAFEPAEILAAWNARERCTEPFLYEFHCVYDFLPCKELAIDQGEHHEYQSTFGRCEDKLGFHRIGETHFFADDSVLPSEFHWTFDEKRKVQGFLNRIEPRSKPIRAYLVPARYPDSQFTNGSELIPFLHYHSPMSVLTHLSREPEKMQVIGRVTVDGTELIEVTMPSKSKSSLCVVVVDPSKGFAPLRMTYYHNGILTRELSCTYARRTGTNAATAHRLATYEYRTFFEGVAYNTRLATVTQAVFGNKVGSSQVFAIDFPAGSLPEADE